VFCLSSHKEGLGTSLLDAMAFSRPIVATAAGGIPEAVEDGVTGRVVPARDPAALAEALLAALRDAELRARLGAAGRRRYLERFTDARMVDETLAVLAEPGP
jgi:glycosyltransferase involved in cell wall biosynthesis